LHVLSIFTVIYLSSAEECTMEARNAISMCALELQTEKILGVVEFMVAEHPQNRTIDKLCEKLTKFHACADQNMKLCAESELRYNHYLISVRAWAYMCITKGIPATSVVYDCVKSLNGTEAFTSCAKQITEQHGNTLSMFIAAEDKTCGLIQSNVNCLKRPMSGSCKPEAFPTLALAYREPLDFFKLKNCTVYVETGASKDGASTLHVGLISIFVSLALSKFMF